MGLQLQLRTWTTAARLGGLCNRRQRAGLDDVDHTRLTGGRQSPLAQGNLNVCCGLAETPCEAAAQSQYPSICVRTRPVDSRKPPAQ